MRLRVYYLSFMICARCCSKRGVFLAVSCQAFARLLSADLKLGLWSRRRVVAYDRYTSCVLRPPDSHFSFVAPYCSSVLRRYFQVNTGVSYLLDYVADVYDDGGLLCPCFNL